MSCSVLNRPCQADLRPVLSTSLGRIAVEPTPTVWISLAELSLTARLLEQALVVPSGSCCSTSPMALLLERESPCSRLGPTRTFFSANTVFGDR